MWPPVLSQTITRSPAIWPCCSKTLTKQHKVRFDRPTAEALWFRLQIQRVLDIHMKHAGKNVKQPCLSRIFQISHHHAR